MGNTKDKKSTSLVITGDFRIVTTVGKLKKGEQLLLSEEEIIKALPEAVRTEPVIAAVRNLNIKALGRFAKVKFLDVSTSQIVPEKDKVQLLRRRLDDCLSKRVRNTLFDCEYLYEIVGVDEDFFEHRRYFGKKGRREISDFLINNGIDQNFAVKVRSIVDKRWDVLKVMPLELVESLKHHSEVINLKGLVRDFSQITIEEIINANWGEYIKRFQNKHFKVPTSEEERRKRNDLIYYLRRELLAYVRGEQMRALESFL